MKKFFEKVNNNKLLFTIFILIAFIMFDFLTSGLGIWTGLTGKFDDLFKNIYNYTYYGPDFIGEVFWFLLLIPVILIFKNKYIFTQKRENIFKSLLVAWPIIIYSIIAFIKSILQIDISNINGYEVIALLLLTLTIGLFEEIMCRGWIQNEFMERFGKDRKGVIFSIIISGIIFGIMHIPNLSFGQDLFETLTQMLFAIVMGVSFGAIYYKTKNIWSVVILHGLWDFAVIFADINAASTCVSITSTIDTITPALGVFALFSSAFTSFPGLGTALMLLGKNDFNMGLDEKYRIKLSDDEIKQSKKTKLVFSIIIAIFLIIYGVIVLLTESMKSDSCPTYIQKNVENYTEKIYDYIDYDLMVSREIKNNKCILVNNENVCGEVKETLIYNYNFKIDDQYNLVLTNMSNGQQYKFDYSNVFSIAIFENNNKYDVILLSESKNGDVITYHSDFITKDNISNSDEFVNDFMHSFKQVMLPSVINAIGYYQEKNNEYKYPLFVARTGESYVLYPNGTIYKYSNEIRKK